MKKILNFKTNTLLKNLIGKDLINDDNIAIVELVKNAYDAGSNSVLIKFDKENDKLIIVDKGKGMSIEDIEDKWLNIAYSEKKLTKQEHGKFLAGNKGVGRFSCDRLGKRLDLLTREAGNTLLHLEVNWPDFEVEGKKDLTIQEIDLEVKDISDEKAAKLADIEGFPEHGTALVISNLRHDWSRDDLLDLKRSLERFLNPNQLFQSDSFKITLEANQEKENDDKEGELEKKVNGLIKNQIFDKLEFKATYIESALSSSDNLIKTELYHDGELVFRLVEKNEDYTLLNDVRVVIFYLNPYKKAYFKRQTGLRSVDFGSIFLFLNGFRISPYGERGNDWLGLDDRKAQGQARFLSSRDVVGRIEVVGPEEKFFPISSREGLKRTPEFLQVKEKYFLDILRKLERFVVDGLGWDSVPIELRNEISKSEGLDWQDTEEHYVESRQRKNQRIALSIMSLIGINPKRTVSFWFNTTLLDEIYQTRYDEVKELIASIEGIDSNKVDDNLKTELHRIRDLIKQKEEEINVAKLEVVSLKLQTAEQAEAVLKLEEEKETFKAQTLFLQSVSSLDSRQLIAFHHQIVHDASIVRNNLGKAIKKLKDLSNSKEIAQLIEKAVLANNRITAIAQFATKANFRASVSAELTDVPSFIQQYVENVAKDFVATNLRVTVKNSVHEAFELKLSRIELSIVIDNIISNADKADARQLFINIVKIDSNRLSISFVDDGKGLSSKLESTDSMFEMGVTTTPGSGLGLFHAKELIEKIGGKIAAIPLQPKGMEIKVEIIK